MVEGRCAKCRNYNHCRLCVCCTVADATVALLPPAGRTRTFAFVATTDPRDAHGAHYARLSATHRIPDGGKVRLQWRDRLTDGSAPVASVTHSERVTRLLDALHARWAMQSYCRG